MSIVKTVLMAVSASLIAITAQASPFNLDYADVDLQMNHETQVAAACEEELGVSYAAGACIVGALTADEIEKCFTDGFGGEGCFGDNNTFVKLVTGNIEAAQREDSSLNQVIRATTGISVRDIEDDGILGGDGSEARKACDFVAGIFGGSC